MLPSTIDAEVDAGIYAVVDSSSWAKFCMFDSGSTLLSRVVQMCMALLSDSRLFAYGAIKGPIYLYQQRDLDVLL